MAEAHAHSHYDALAAAEARCAHVGEHLTPLRRRVLELLLAHHGPAKAYDLLEKLKIEHAAAKPPTVYRALEFLVRLGLAHKVESQSAFIACVGGHGHAPALVLLCNRCGDATEADSGPLFTDAHAAAETAGFALETLVIEASGVCGRCQKAA